MVFVFIIAGAIIAGIFLQSFEFSMIGAFLGFLLAKLQQLSGTVNQLRKSVNELTYKLNSRTQQSSEQTLTGSKQAEPIEPSPDTDTSAAVTAYKSTYTEKRTIEKNEVTQTSLQKTDHAELNSPKKSTDQHTKPKKPDFIDKVTQLVTNYFTQGNLVVRVGAIILFFGVAFLLKYAAENSNISMQTRLIGVAVSAIVLLAFGWKLKDKRQGYGLILQGAAVGILYLTLFAAFRLYDMIPPTMAFAFMFLFSALTMLLAVLQDSRSLATLSISGGFLAPVLTSTGAGSHVALFGYYAILNLSIFAVAWFKSWRLLNLIGFAFTFIIGAAWGVTKYASEDFSTTEPFLILFFLLYTAIAVLFSVKQKPSLKGYVDGTLIFGLPLVCFSLQAAMVQEIEFVLAWSSFATGAFYLSLAYFILRGKNDYLKVIAEAFVALGIIFVSLVIPFALDGEWTAASWAIEGAGLIWIGLKQKRWFAKYFGALIQAAGGSIFLLDILSHSGSNQTFFNSTLLGIVFVAVASLFSSYQIWYKRNELKWFEKPSHIVFLIWGLLWWYLGGISEIASHSQHGHDASNFIWFLTLSGLLLFGIELRFKWIVLSQTSWVTLAFGVLTAMLILIDNKHLLEGWRLVFAWISLIISSYWCSYQRETQSKWQAKLPAANHVLHLVYLVFVMLFSAIEVIWLIKYLKLANSGWGVSLFGLLITFWIFLLSKVDGWPFNKYPNTYSVLGLSMALLAGVFWSFILNFPMAGRVEPLLYIPALNPLDVVQGLLTIMAIAAFDKLSKQGIKFSSDVLKIALAIFSFIWLNVILLRSINAWVGIPYEQVALFSSSLVQTSISIFWTILGLTGTIYASKISSRKTWIYAAALLGVVVLKLFMVDLDNSSSIERIVSFLVVGLLLLIVGYFSPLPENSDQILNKNRTKGEAE